MIRTAILIDGGFYRRRAYSLWGDKSSKDRADELEQYCKIHLNNKKTKEDRYLYRIFYYDCPPFSRKIYHPFLQKQIDYTKTDLHTWMVAFLSELKHKRKFALRMGNLAEEQANYSIRYDKLKKLCNGTITWNDLAEEDFVLNIKQKGVDMKIGVDIASLAYKKQVDQIILISGDSDFVPASKLARREGIDFILDPMQSHIKEDLFEHIDGIRTCYFKDKHSEKVSFE